LFQKYKYIYIVIVCAFVAEPDEPVGVLSQTQDHLQEVVGVQSDCLTEGQTLGADVEPSARKNTTEEERRHH